MRKKGQKKELMERKIGDRKVKFNRVSFIVTTKLYADSRCCCQIIAQLYFVPCERYFCTCQETELRITYILS